MNFEDVMENSDGSGSLDAVTSHGWLSRLFLRLKFQCTCCAGIGFERGATVQIFPVAGDRVRGTVKISRVRRSYFTGTVLEFENELPPGTRKGDLLVVTNAR